MCDSSGKNEYYVSKRAKAEDLKSTAYTFTCVSILGMVVLLLFVLGVLPLQTADYMKVLMSVVLGIMLAIFLTIGIRSFVQLKPLFLAADKEDALFQEISGWIRDTWEPAVIDREITDSEEEQVYFRRYAIMQRMLKDSYPELETAFADHIIDTLYGELFPETDSDL
jgi:hypothetical protein